MPIVRFHFKSEIEEAFTEGDCWRLAWKLHELTNWELWGIISPSQVEVPAEYRMHVHFFVLDPEGHALDIKGIHETGPSYAATYGRSEEHSYFCTKIVTSDFSHRLLQGSPEYPQHDVDFYAQRVLQYWEKRNTFTFALNRLGCSLKARLSVTFAKPLNALYEFRQARQTKKHEKVIDKLTTKAKAEGF